MLAVSTEILSRGSSPKRGDAFDDPKYRKAANRIGWRSRGPCGRSHIGALGDLSKQRDAGKDENDKEQLTDLNADIEEQERKGYLGQRVKVELKQIEHLTIEG
jgi:hypothetical protein